MPKEHVFLSYCHDNDKEVEQLRKDLIAAGEQVWWDGDIKPGQNIRHEIREAMERSYAVILCFSKETEAREESGMYPEARDAIRVYRELSPGSIFIIPVRLSRCKIPGFDIDGPTTLHDLKYIDLFPPLERAARLSDLIDSLRSAPAYP